MNTTKYPLTTFHEGPPPQAPATKSLISLEYLGEISADHSFIQLMLDAFKGEAIKFLHSFESELTSNDFISMQKTAHRMKPTGACIGANLLTVLITNLEQAVKREDGRETSSLFGHIQTMIKNMLTEIDQLLR